MRTTLVRSSYLELYKKRQPISILKHLNRLKEIPYNKDSFGYSTTLASVHSSLIEGNTIDLDTYLKYTFSGMNTKSKSYQEIQDLIKAYGFAEKSKLTFNNFLKSHALLAKTLISETRYRGRIRDREVYIYSGGIKRYTGAPVSIVFDELVILFNDIEILLKRDLSTSESFYFASMIHLVLAQIHPFADGNGRSARLLEKWFLAERLGKQAWLIPSEKLYQIRIKSYYKNIDLGDNYLIINYDLSIPFLLMLPMALTLKK